MSAVTTAIRNGMDTAKLFATLDLIKEQPELARFQFRASNRWIDGSHNRSTSDRGRSPAAATVRWRTSCSRRPASRPRCGLRACPVG